MCAYRSPCDCDPQPLKNVAELYVCGTSIPVYVCGLSVGRLILVGQLFRLPKMNAACASGRSHIVIIPGHLLLKVLLV